MVNNYILRTKQFVEKRLNPVFYILITLFWIGQVWAAIDDFATQGNLNIFQNFFRNEIIYKVNFSMVIVLFTSIFLIHKFQKYYRFSKFPFYFFIFTFITFILINLLNPNNHFELRHYFGNHAIKIYYLFILFLFSMIFLEQEILIFIVKKFFYVGSIVLFLRVVLSLILFVLNMGMKWQGRNVTISQGDTLALICIFQIIYFAMFLDNKNYKNLFISIIYLITLFFSYRRTSLWIALTTNFAIAFYFLYIVKYSRKKIKASLMILLLFISMILILYVIVGKVSMNDFLFRAMSAFSYLFQPSQNIGYGQYTDSGHFEQSIQTTISFFNNIQFWGSGLGKTEVYYVEGQTTAIHNSYVHAWATYGLHMTIFLFVLLLLFLHRIIKIFVKAIRKRYFTDCLTFGIIFYLFMFSLSGWLTGASLLGNINYLTLFVLLFCFMVLTSKDFKYSKKTFF